ncbi:transposase [Belnapia sp. T6]|uniref:Transposase n=1 Tax=Belnapia mucosa TaxID=2804532 RepID=A0ABS1VD30_9PROT|nr:transposase [Belnapia mucosa]
MKTTESGGPRGYDAAKKVKGRKRHVAVDTQGLLLGALVHAVFIQDADSAGELLRRIKPLYNWLRAVFADSIYGRLAVLLACFLLGLTLVVVRRVAGTKGFVLLPRRWVVERTIGWLGRWRRLSKDYEQRPEVAEAMVTLATIRLCFTASLTQTAGDVLPRRFQNRICASLYGDHIRESGSRIQFHGGL